MVGAGNDFIVIDLIGARPAVPLQPNRLRNLAIKMCARETGIGADGLLILDKSKKADYRMRVINADGSEAEMCGNGARCLAVYIAHNKKPKKKSFTIKTLSGILLGEAKDETAAVRLSDPKDYQPNINILVNDQRRTVSYIDTGVPHTILFVDSLDKIDVNTLGPLIRNHPRFAPRGTNVNFVEQIGKDMVAVRTYERGVEAETKACGTGSVAAGIVGFLKSHAGTHIKEKASMKVLTKSTEVLNVSFKLQNNHITNVWLKGSAKFIAKGEYYYV